MQIVGPQFIIMRRQEVTISENNETTQEQYAFDEFELFYQSAEKVTERRLATNRWNYSICIAILVAIAGIISWATSNANFLLISLFAVVILSGMAILFCTMWVGQIHSFKMLNTAKFEVLNRMAPLVAFSPEQCDDRVSYSPFEKEWEFLQQKNKALEEIGDTQILALKSSNIEYLIPRAFRFLFIFIILVAILSLFANWNTVTSSPLTVHLTSTVMPSSTPIFTPTP
jgi:hypothetical protein